MSASALIADVHSIFAGEPVYLTGSLVAEDVYGKVDAHKDVDLFVPTKEMMCVAIERLLHEGYTLDDRHDRAWYNYKHFGVGSFHTNSMRLFNGTVETNVVHKKLGRQPLRALEEVIASFDFGLLAVGYDLELGSFHDFRSAFFPGLDPDGPLPLMPSRQKLISRGQMSRHTALRQGARVAKYAERGYDMSLVVPVLIDGYEKLAVYLSTSFKEENRGFALVCETIAAHLGVGNWQHLLDAEKELDKDDELDAIMAALT